MVFIIQILHFILCMYLKKEEQAGVAGHVIFFTTFFPQIVIEGNECGALKVAQMLKSLSCT